MHTYQSTRVLPYVYICQDKNSPKFYIGYRFANKVPSTQDFGTHYFTSNEYVRENFDQFEHHIVAEFFHKRDAYAFESQLIIETRSEHQINYLKHTKMVGLTYKRKTPYVQEAKICPFPGCGKEHYNYRMKCCCLSHSRRYAGQKSHSSKTPY
jgi:hypothetical protein